MMDFDEGKLKMKLNEAISRIHSVSPRLNFSCKSGNIQEVIDRGVDILEELQTNVLPPRMYYELYMIAVGELNCIEDFFMSAHRKGTPIVEIYQRVQACTKILPRLYLLFAAGVCCIKSKDVPVNDVLSDMIDMAKGVQNPMKGLFLRNYLGHISTVLPMSESSYEVKDGIRIHTVQFLLVNLSECNKLWARLHHRSKVDKIKHEKMRNDLRLLVGTNLVRLSRLEGLTARMYKDVILPRVMENITSSRDTVSQSYLMDCVIQVFPDDFHIYALEPFLDGVLLLKERVKVRSIMESLLHRLGEYVKRTPSAIPEDSSVISLLEKCVSRLIAERKDPNIFPEILQIQVTVINFLGLCMPPHAQVRYIEEALDMCRIGLYTKVLIQPNIRMSEDTASAVEAILSVSLKVIGLNVFGIRPFFELLKELPIVHQRHIAVDILIAVISANQPLVDFEVLGNLLSSIAPLLLDIPFEPSPEDIEAEGKGEGADLTSRVAALIGIGCTPPVRYQLYCLARDRFLEGSAPFSARTLVPLVFSALKLALEVRQIELEPLAADEKTDPTTPAPVKVEERIPPHPTVCEDSRVDLAFDEVEELEGKPSTVDQDNVEPSGGSSEPVESTTISGASPVVGEEEQKPPSSISSDAGDQENGDGKSSTPDSIAAEEQDRPISPPSLATNKEQDQNMSSPPPPRTDAVTGPKNAHGKAVLEGLSSRKVFQFVHEVVTGIAPQVPAQALQLFLQSALAADKTNLQAIAYEFMSQACILYEDEIASESKDQLRSLIYMAGTLRACYNFNTEDYESLVTKTTYYASKLHKKSEQCHVVLLCSHLFYRSDIEKSQKEDDPYHDSGRVLECLKRCLKLADACAARNASSNAGSIFLFLDILHQYTYFLEAGCNAVTIKIIRALVMLIRDRVAEIQDPAIRKAMNTDIERRLSMTLYTLVQMRQEYKQNIDPESVEEKSLSPPCHQQQEEQQ